MLVDVLAYRVFGILLNAVGGVNRAIGNRKLALLGQHTPSECSGGTVAEPAGYPLGCIEQGSSLIIHSL